MASAVGCEVEKTLAERGMEMACDSRVGAYDVARAFLGEFPAAGIMQGEESTPVMMGASRNSSSISCEDV